MTTDLKALGDTLKNAAGVITDRVANDATIDFDAKSQLSSQADDLIIQSKDLYARATIDIAANIQTSIKGLTDAQADISKALKTISTVQTIINIATSLVSVASNILSGNLGQVITDAQSILTAIDK